MLATGQTSFVDLISSMGSGISGMFVTCMVAVLVAALCALIREYGGFEAAAVCDTQDISWTKGRSVWHGAFSSCNGYRNGE